MNSSMLGFICFLFSFQLAAQDIHFSQFQNTPLYISPSYTGFFSGAFRVNAAYRNQWNAVTVPYQTFYVSFDGQLLKRNYKQDMLGIGLTIFHDIAGDSDFGTMEGTFSMSYVKAFNRKNNHFIGLGVAVGVGQRSIRYNDLYFDSQWDGSAYNPNLSSTENFSKTQFWFYDISAGLHWYYQMKKQLGFEAGAAMWHINKPKMTLFTDQSIVLNSKINIFAKAPITIGDNTNFVPEVLLMIQNPYNEFLFGGSFKFFTDTKTNFYSAINAGIFLRLADAAVVSVGVDYRKLNVGFSYDINFSRLNVASNAQGGPEITLQYIIDKKKRIKHKEVPCPIF
ncbi:MAG: PorP/SprF family type IX secretion system membrane protein [Bacteroidota bacterium]